MDCNISAAEWNVMRVVWTLQETHSDQIIKQLQASQDWSDSTIKTLLRRLVKKGLIATQKDGRRFIYSARVSQPQMDKKAAEDVFSRVCDMFKGQILIDAVQNSPLSQSDITQLEEILAEKKKSAPQMVPCNCLSQVK